LAFLRDEWNSQTYALTLRAHQLYVALEDECYLYTADGRTVNRTQIHEHQSGHDEADTRLLFHTNFVAANHDMCPVIVIRSNDTDVLLVHHARYIHAQLWMDAGVNSKNTRRMIGMSHLATELTAPICDALPSFHALTGCDYTASFMRKVKWKPFEIMKDNPRFAAAISHLGGSDVIDPDVTALVEEYLCVVYGVRNLTSVNEARLHLFRKSYAPKKEKDPLDKINAADPCCLPPYQIVLQQKLLRTNFVAYVWTNARDAQPVAFGPDGHGWKVDRDRKSL